MSETPTTHGGVKRVMAPLLSIVALFAFIQVNATLPAEASTSRYWSVVEWNITGLGDGRNQTAAENYRRMVREVRNLSGDDTLHAGVMQTTQQTERYIEIRIRDDNDVVRNRVSLYLRLDNLYLDGFTIGDGSGNANSSRNYRFSDAPSYLVTRFANQYRTGNRLFESLGYTSQYGRAGLDTNAEERGAQRFNGPSFGQVIWALRGFNMNNSLNARWALSAIIGATSEAARAGWIENRIALSVGQDGQWDGERYADTIGGFGADLENDWAALSRLVYRLQHNGTGNPDPVTINRRTYDSIDDIVNGHGINQPAIAPFLSLGSAR